ncbi:PD-(D/E)XK nuclease family protein [Candidatus Aerophobetes bacterium]|nr:PD-(D/E)XK nuclease family protein [Candidatus Aerophobetes bacterium]
MDIFDILGIGSREDSYTDLIAYAFEHSTEFREKMLKMLGEEVPGNWEVFVRPSVAIKSESGRKKDVPDLVLLNRSGPKVLLIENKIYSGEGWMQTERYASDEFKSNLKEYLKLDTIPEVNYFFLTLDGTKPYSKDFKAISYSDILKCIPENLGQSRLDILLKELKGRLEEYYSWPSPEEDEIVIDYLKKTDRLVSTYRTFIILTDSLLDKGLASQFQKECGITANPGSGYIPLCSWYKESWISKEYPQEKDGACCYNIHFEFQWDTKDDSLSLYLHYETNPYMTQKELKEVGGNFVDKYQQARDEFFDYIKNNPPKEWKIKKTPLGVAHYEFDKGIRFGELKKDVNSLIKSMTRIVDNYVNSHFATCN